MPTSRPRIAKTHVWLTPPWVLRALGSFDLDPCAAPDPRPWPTAKRHLIEEDDGLSKPWSGRVWLNPPYGGQEGAWLDRLSEHGQGTALIFARTETRAFARVWASAWALLFIEGRLTFHHPDGTPGYVNSGAPSVLVAYGERDARALAKSGIPGALIQGART